jgi:hypothetical protein
MPEQQEMNLIYNEKFENINDKIKELQKKMDDEDTAKILVKLQVLHDVGQEDAKKNEARLDKRDALNELRAEKRDGIIDIINNNINKLANMNDVITSKILDIESKLRTLESKFEVSDNKTKIDTSMLPKAALSIIVVAITSLVILLAQKLLKY